MFPTSLDYELVAVLCAVISVIVYEEEHMHNKLAFSIIMVFRSKIVLKACIF